MGVVSLVVASLVLARSAPCQVTERVTVSSRGQEGVAGGDVPAPTSPLVSLEGRVVGFLSFSSNLTSGDVNGHWDVFVRDRLMGLTEMVSCSSSGAQGNANSGSFGIAVTPDGRFVAFESPADTLVPGDTNGQRDIFVRDRTLGTTERASLGTGRLEANDQSLFPTMSDDGRFVAFTSEASNLVNNDNNNVYDVFVRDRVADTTELVSVAMGGGTGNRISYIPCISGNGRYVAFESEATNLVSGDTNGVTDVFVRDLAAGTTTRVSVGPGGAQADGMSNAPSISSDGRFIAFQSYATNLISGDSNGTSDVFVYDQVSGTTERVSVATGGVEGNDRSTLPAISADGRFVAFVSTASNLIVRGTSVQNVYRRDRQMGITELVSMTTNGTLANAYSGQPSISPDGRVVEFQSGATDMVPGDHNAHDDVFVRDFAAASFVRICSPGTGSVMSCPCANPPSGDNRGCDNSAATGGASLSASGAAYLSIDSLVLQTAGETPTGMSILIQGTAVASSGRTYGQGVRCAAGILRRLFTKTAVGGSVATPDFGAGDPTISTRSSSLGDVIHPGQRRWYLVFYRDRSVLGGCPSTSTFNVTQTGEVTWWP